MTKSRIREIRAAIRLVEDEATAMMLTECIIEIEHIQAFTRQGKLPDQEPEPEPLPPAASLPKKAKGATDPRIAQFIDGWHTAFLDRFKEKYKVQGVKDAMATKRLIQTGTTVDQLLDLAWEAWKHPERFNCKQAATILGFEQRFNDIRIELKTIANGGRPTTTEPAGCNL